MRFFSNAELYNTLKQGVVRRSGSKYPLLRIGFVLVRDVMLYSKERGLAVKCRLNTVGV